MSHQNNLKCYRLQNKLTQAEVAAVVGIAERYYQKLEYGKSQPNVTTAQKLAKVLGAEIGEIFPLPWE